MNKEDTHPRMSTMIENLLHVDTITATEMIAEDVSIRVLSIPKTLSQITRNLEQVATVK